MLLYFSDVVRHVIDHMHIQIIRSGIENFGKSLTEKKKTCEEVVGTGTSKVGNKDELLREADIIPVWLLFKFSSGSFTS